MAPAMRSSRLRWHRWHTAVLLALTAAWACGGKATSGSEGASSRSACTSDRDCTLGACIDGQCSSPPSGNDSGVSVAGAGGTAGTGTTPSHDSGTTGTGITSQDSGCGGQFVFTLDPALSTGGAYQEPPTCTLDALGFATTTFDVLCDSYRCPSRATDLVGDLDCSEVVDNGAEGITIGSGCGFDTVRISGTGFTYQATFDATQDVLTALEVQSDDILNLAGCLAYGFKAGEASPDCPSDVLHHCVRPADPAGTQTVCREPAQEGCAACCSPWSSGDLSGCTVATSSNGPRLRYDYYWSDQTPCACNCPPCATCTTEAEYKLRVQPEKPECNCPPVGTGGASGTGGVASTGGASDASPCDWYCTGLNTLLAECPDVPR
jgi:hypothetical protein